jgi:hypothetical protein
MNTKDYDLLISICQYALAKSNQLNCNQVADIDKMIQMLYNERNRSNAKNALVISKKLGKKSRIRNS